MRQPTPWARLYAVHQRLLAGDWSVYDETDPQPGWFRIRLVRGGPWIPAVIWVEQVIDPETGELTEPERLLCLIDGEPKPPGLAWGRMKPITQEAYEALVALKASESRMAATKVKLNLAQLPLGPL